MTRHTGAARTVRERLDWPLRPIEMQSTASGELILAGQCYLSGFSLVNNSTSAGTVTIYDGTDAKGTQLDPVALAASSTLRVNYPHEGIFCEQGIFVVAAGIFAQGTLWVRFEKPDEAAGHEIGGRWAEGSGPGGNGPTALHGQHSG